MATYRNHPALSIWGDATYVTGVAAVLDFIFEQSSVGALLLREIDRQRYGPVLLQVRPGIVEIVPADSVDHLEAQEDDTSEATAIGRPCVENGVATVGEGLGSSAVVRFTPDMLPSGAQGGINNRESVMVHELTHAVRMKMGVAWRSPVSDDFDDAEEFFGVMVENYFRSGLGWPLRANHHGHQRMPDLMIGDPFANPDYLHLMQAYGYLIVRFRREMGSFADSLESLDDGAFSYNLLKHYRDLEANGLNPTMAYPIPGSWPARQLSGPPHGRHRLPGPLGGGRGGIPRPGWRR